MTSVISLNVKLWLDVILVVLIVMIQLSIVRKKIDTTECDKSMVRSNVDIAQCNNGTVKFEKKNRVPLNVTKIESDAILVLFTVTMEPSNLRKNK